MEKTTVNNPKKQRYPLASAFNRISARFLDSLLITIPIIGLAFLMFTTDPTVDGPIDILKNSYEPWRYFIFTLIALLIFFLYFILLPCLWKGFTVFKYFLKLQIYNQIFTKSFFLNLIKRESLIWMIVGVTNVLVGGACLIYGENAVFFLNALVFSNNIDGGSYVAVAAIFQTIYSISGLVLMVLIIYMCVKNKKRAIQDHISDTVVVKLIDTYSNDPNDKYNTKSKKPTRNFSLPGEIKTGALEEIDSF